MSPELTAVLFGGGFVALVWAIYGIMCWFDLPDFGGISKDDEEVIMISMLATCT